MSIARPAPPSADLAEIHAALERPGVLGVGPVDRIETHLSVILLVGARAFKRAKPVDYGFVDAVSTAARRRIAFAETALNPMAGDLYLGVRPVVSDGAGGARLGPLLSAPEEAPTEAVEFLVEMRRFDREDEYDRLLAAGALPDREIYALADLVAAAHVAAPKVAPDGGGAGSTRRTMDNVAGTLALTAEDSALAAEVAAWRRESVAAWETVAARLDARARHGRVRRCHGDLHLGNVVRVDGSPRPFDAIAFNDALIEIDALYDAAFTVMDLRRLGGVAPATRFLNRYLSATRDYSGLAVLPLFVSLRAAIRAMTSLLGGEPATATRFLALARAALAPRPTPRLIAVGGGSGVGKSTLARRLVEAPELIGPDAVAGATWLRTDVIRKRMLGVLPEHPAPPASYEESVSSVVRARLRKDAARALDAGAVVVADAVFLRAEWRAAAAGAAAAAGRRFDGVFLEADTELRARRAAHRAEMAPEDPSDAGAEIARRQLPERPTEPGWVAISAEDAPDAVRAAALAALLGSTGSG